jgi:single-stranded-DNA-specific exonuclease
LIPSYSEGRFRIWEPDESVGGIARECGCSLFVASLLKLRGADCSPTQDGIRKWMSPDLDYWLTQIELGSASERAYDLWSKVGKGSNVVVYGDYDVDGIASTTFMLELAMLRGARVRYYIPHRYNQGYGFHPSVVQTIAKSNCPCDMLVVVDCGTQNIEAAEMAKSYGIPVIIFDHHLARGDLAASDALINPHVDGNDLGRQLCATGVVWCWAWKNGMAPRSWLMQNLDVVALATIADCVPMSSPVNRAIVREGINEIRTNPRQGLQALVDGMELDLLSLDSDLLSMRIIPCLNAAGRLELADLSMKIFFPSHDIGNHAQKLIDLNRRRRDLSAKIISDVEQGATGDSRYAHVLFGEDWPAGVLSSVASHVCALRDAPIVLAAPAQPTIIRGTLRVPQGVDAEAILSSISEDLVSWGGHRMAAGFSASVDKWPVVRDKLEDILANTQSRIEKEEILHWSPAELDIDVWREAERLGPFGIGNPHPRLFCSQRGMMCVEPLGRKGNHVKVIVEGRELLAFWGDHLLHADSTPSGWVYKPRINLWRDLESLQLVVEKIVVNEP